MAIDSSKQQGSVKEIIWSMQYMNTVGFETKRETICYEHYLVSSVDIRILATYKFKYLSRSHNYKFFII